MDESSRDEAQFSRKVASGKRVADAIRSVVSARNLQPEYAMVLHESLLVSVLMYGNEINIWKEKKNSRSVQMDNLRGLPGIRRMDKLNAQIRQLCGVKKAVDEKIYESSPMVWPC